MSNMMGNLGGGFRTNDMPVRQEAINPMVNDQIIAADLLSSVKTGVRNYAYAVTETESPQVRQTLQQHLNEAIQFHEKVAGYMISKGYYHPHNVQQQVQIDLQSAQQVLRMQG